MSTFRDFADISRGAYGVILADPPWTFVTRSGKGKGRSPEKHYGCMTLDQIKALPVASLGLRNSALGLWVPDPHLELGLEVMKAWGFKYKTVLFTWVKRNKCAKPAKAFPPITPYEGAADYWTDDQFFTGMGYWTRANPEMCLFGTIGAPKRQFKDVRQLIVSKRREHSRKPDETYQRVERLLPGPYLELFARSAAPGWDAWGNQVGKFGVNVVDSAPPAR
jgi:N6-adenosine-specific RNA methylase IME4